MTADAIWRILRPLLIPAILILGAAAGYKFRPELLPPVLPYLLWGIAVLIGVRYQDTGMILTGLLMGVVFHLLPSLRGGGPGAGAVLGLVTLTLPINIPLFAALGPRRIRTPAGLTVAFLLCTQALSFWFITRFATSSLAVLMTRENMVMAGLSQALKGVSLKLAALFSATGVSLGNLPALSLFLLAGILLFYRFAKSRDILITGYIGTLAAVYISLLLPGKRPLLFYFSAAALCLIVAKIEASFAMAFNDELTGLPGRRSLNQAMLNLRKKYTIAMMDIDHFKKFNDTYGHKTGDEVLKMVAAQIRRISGSARTFRYGGEEFTALFPGKSAKDALPHLEKLREAIETTPFIIRDRASRKKGAEGGKRLPQSKRKQVQVTISIGVAECGRKHDTAGQVIKAADAALYKAKGAGRNCVKT